MSDYTKELVPGYVFHEGDLTTLYWIKNGKVLYRHYPIRGADPESFRFYVGGFGKDKKHCYCASSRLTGATPIFFRALNYTYAADDRNVWTLGGRLKDVDATSFVVCDDGARNTSFCIVPYGYGKDKNRVYYYDFDGVPNWVRKANPLTFVSLWDGIFGKDESFAFCGTASLPKAKVLYWKKIGGYYSKDDTRVFYFNRRIQIADYDSFEIILARDGFTQLAKDKNNYYLNDTVIDAEQFLKLKVE